MSYGFRVDMAASLIRNDPDGGRNSLALARLSEMAQRELSSGGSDFGVGPSVEVNSRRF